VSGLNNTVFQMVLLPAACEVLKVDYGIFIQPGSDYAQAFDCIIDLHGMREFNSLPVKHKQIIIKQYLTHRSQSGRNHFNLVAACISRLKVVDRRAAKQKRRKDSLALRRSRHDPVTPAAAQAEHLTVLAGLPREKFYHSKEWKIARFEALRQGNHRCNTCGATAKEGRLHVDHIVTRVARPDLAFSLSNLRVLCETCHHGRHLSDGQSAHLKQSRHWQRN
jgi:5-methylcytosine-specific restriction endonuclease McrA